MDLPHPFPRHLSPDSRPRIAIYAHYPHTLSSLPPHTYRRIIVQVFTELYAAKHFARLFITDPLTGDLLPFTCIGSDQIHIPSTDTLVYTRPLRSSPITLTQILEHRFTPAQSAYRLPNSIARQPAALSRPFQVTSTIDPDSDQPTPIPTAPTRTRTRREPRQTLKSSGLIHVSQISTSLNITPREARQALRTSRTPKPRGGWWFPPDQLQHYTDLITKHLKKR